MISHTTVATFKIVLKEQDTRKASAVVIVMLTVTAAVALMIAADVDIVGHIFPEHPVVVSPTKRTKDSVCTS